MKSWGREIPSERFVGVTTPNELDWAWAEAGGELHVEIGGTKRKVDENARSAWPQGHAFLSGWTFTPALHRAQHHASSSALIGPA